MMTDPIADLLIRFKNACRAKNETFTVPHSRTKVAIIALLQKEGYFWKYETKDIGQNKSEIEVKIRYTDKIPSLTDIKRVSKPGRRQYVKADAIPRVLNGMGISIISTSHGIMTGHEAKKQKLGGELLAFVW